MPIPKAIFIGGLSIKMKRKNERKQNIRTELISDVLSGFNTHRWILEISIVC